ncbi:MAG: hypothetical protein VBE63_05585, partial [Lamprobacter sp.]|uniref:hypothetical protein n=1 Tax=Lamprobacter sp. TaxID=3100796 RepID=UPI002B259FA1
MCPELHQRIDWIEKNPHHKRAGSQAGMRFARYHGAETVAEYFERGGTRYDLKYDSEHHLLAVLQSTLDLETTSRRDQAMAPPTSGGGIYLVT